MNANNSQVGGSHYRVADGSLQHWDIVNHFNLDYFQGQITKYVMRWRAKGGLQDLKKAQHFLAKYIELNQPPSNVKSNILRSTNHFTFEGAQKDTANYTCRKCGHNFWVDEEVDPEAAHDCPGRHYVSQG